MPGDVADALHDLSGDVGKGLLRLRFVFDVDHVQRRQHRDVAQRIYQKGIPDPEL